MAKKPVEKKTITKFFIARDIYVPKTTPLKPFKKGEKMIASDFLTRGDSAAASRRSANE